MNKIVIEKINEEIYSEKLDNGLMVYLYVNPNIHNNYVTFTTKYGSVYNEFLVNKDGKSKVLKYPNGIAHFLEHKVFVQKEGLQPEEFYAKSGAMCNAYTTFKNTTYLFSGIDNIEENINYLLDFVQDIYLTDENVESEKGIIIQEINMCNDRPGDKLYEKIRENAIWYNPFRESIIGTKGEVNSITKEQLMDCYNRFYHPENMFLVVTGNFDKDKVMEVIKENQSKKKFPDSVIKSIEVEHDNKKDREPDCVKKEYEVVKCNTNIPKMAYTIKIPIDKKKMDIRKYSIYLYIIFNKLFGDTSDFDELAKQDGIITNTLYYNVLNIDTHFIVSLINNGDKYEEFIKRIDKEFLNIKFSESELDRKKRVLISNEVFSYENIEMVNDMIIDNIIFDNKIENNMIEIINSLNIQEMNEIVKGIDFSNKSIVVLERK